MQELCADINKKQITKKQANDCGIEKESKLKKEPMEVVKKFQEDSFRSSLKSVSSIRNGTLDNQNGEAEEEEKEVKSEDEINGETVEKLRELETETLPPKPMPRSSRSNSVDIFEDRPVAKPRTHKNSLESSQTIILEAFRKSEADDEFIFIEKVQPCVIQSVNPLMPISGGYKVRNLTNSRFLL